VGLQIGVHKEHIIVLLMSDAAVKTFSNDNIKFAVDMTMAAGPSGHTVEASKHAAYNGEVEVFTYSRSEGVHFGAGLKGMMVATCDNDNAAYYNMPALISGGPRAIDYIQGDALAGKQPTDMVKLLQQHLEAAGKPRV